MAQVSDKPWSSVDESDYETAEEYCDACLIDMNPPGKPKTKSLCKVPVKMPDSMGGMTPRGGRCDPSRGILLGERLPGALPAGIAPRGLRPVACSLLPPLGSRRFLYQISLPPAVAAAVA